MGVWIVWSTAVGDWRELMARNHRGKELKNHAPSQDRRQPKRERYLVGESCTKLTLFQRNPGWWNKKYTRKMQPWFYLSVLYSEKLLLDVTRWWTKATDLMCTSWASNNKGQIQYTTKATLCNTNIHNEPLHKMRDYKSWPNLRVCIFKNLLIQFSPWGQLLGLVCIAADSLYVKVRPIRGTIGIWTSGGDPGQSPAKNSMRGQLWPLVLGFPFMFSCLWSMTDKKWFGSFSQKVESSCCFHTVIRIETTIHASFSPENRFLHAVCMAIVSNFKAPLSPANLLGRVTYSNDVPSQ